jgi:hypothetical protein
LATISRFGFLSHLRAEPNQFVLHYRRGRLVRSGAGLAYWFNPLSAAVAQVPAEDCETTFLLQERSADMQEVTVQCTLTYRVADPQQAAARINFTIALSSGAWVEQPLEKLAQLWAQRAQPPARAYLMGVPLVEALVAGAEVIRTAIEDALRSDPEMSARGLALVGAQVNRVAPQADLEKALQTPTRESIQQKADQATFERRALAVEKERAIKENELVTEVELARRQEELIRRQGANRLLQMQTEAEAERARVEAEVQRQAVIADGYARDAGTRATGDADARRALAAADAEADAKRVEVWERAPGRVLLGLALQQLAGKIDHVQHLNLSPDVLGDALREFLRDQAGK